ncbi:hypothetical protein AY599_09785 [Leptolyngbya valderiana BDU 20041]|nr:hypothetical protein AY599_09785 [Leptolyngbya valderiana BDU 20041]
MAGKRQYDAIVIGAGPAGALAAGTLAARDVRTLMVDKSVQGRWKVCGCCLGELGQRVLSDLGLSDRVLRAAEPLRRIMVAAGGKQVDLGLSGFVSISRESLDAALVAVAQERGVETRWNTTATIHADGRVQAGGEELLAGVVIDASGLRSHARRVAKSGRIGLGMTAEVAGGISDVLTMAVARGGYVGRVELPDGRTDFAMAATPAFVRQAGSPTEAARSIYRHAGLDPAEVPDGRWHGTPVLTRQARAQEGRILRVGDAAGYVEPFTGEGMSWALLGGSRIADDAMACAEHGPDASNWPAKLHSLLAARQARCRAVSIAVRSPGLLRTAIGLASMSPGIGTAGAGMLSGSRRSVA